MKGKTAAEARAELEAAGLKGDAVDTLLPHKVTHHQSHDTERCLSGNVYTTFVKRFSLKGFRGKQTEQLDRLQEAQSVHAGSARR